MALEESKKEGPDSAKLPKKKREVKPIRGPERGGDPVITSVPLKQFRPSLFPFIRPTSAAHSVEVMKPLNGNRFSSSLYCLNTPAYWSLRPHRVENDEEWLRDRGSCFILAENDITNGVMIKSGRPFPPGSAPCLLSVLLRWPF